MKKMSHKQILIITCASLVALAILLSAIFLSPKAPKNPKKNNNTIAPVNPDELPPSVGLNNNDSSDNLRSGPGNSIQNVEGASFTRMNHGRIIQLRWKTLAPKSKGVSLLSKPRAKITFSPTQVLTIHADNARLLAPGNHLQKAHFTGHVVATLYIASHGNKPDIDSTRDIAARIYLQKTTFDMELSTLSSDGKVYMTGPNVEFSGRGLNLKFDRVDNKLKKLVIAKGNFLRLHLQNKKFLPQSPSSQSTSKTSTSTSNGAPVNSDNNKVQYYQAVFFKDVRVNAPSRKINMLGDKLKVILPSKGLKTSNSAVSSPVSNGSNNKVKNNKTISNNNSNSSIKEFENSKSLTPISKDDIIIKWGGKLTISPVSENKFNIPEDGGAKLVMSGQPLQIAKSSSKSRKNNTDKQFKDNPFKLQAAQFTFLAASQTVSASGTSKYPLVISAPNAGKLSAGSMTIKPKEHLAQFVGAGWLHQKESKDKKGLKVSWDKKLNINFFKNTKKADSKSQIAAFGPIKTAVFTGKVHANHPQFDVHSNVLHISFAKNGRLTNDNQVYPKQISARGDVIARQDKMTLASNRLDLSLYVATKKTNNSSPTVNVGDNLLHGERDLAKSNILVQQMIAGGNVKVKLAKRDVKVFANQLIANPVNSTLTILGTKVKPAKIYRSNSKISARRILMNQRKRAVDVPGAGKLSLVMVEKNKSDSNNASAQKTTLTTRWDKFMHFEGMEDSDSSSKSNNAAYSSGKVKFVGNVVNTTNNKIRSTNLHCDVLKLRFSSQSKLERKNTRGTQSVSSISRAKAQGSVVFTSHSILGKNSNKPSQRFRLEGKQIDFDRLDQKIYIPGAGKMLIENNKGKIGANKTSTSSIKNSDSNNTITTGLSGSGDTLFAWDGGMTIDTKNSSCTLSDNVWMIHKPSSGESNTTLSCQNLTAKLTSSSGITGLNSSSANNTKAKLKSVRADGKISISQAQKQIDADHMRYLATKQLITLWSDSGSLVTVRTANQPTGFAAGLVKWNLDNDTFEAQKVKGGVAPAGR